jgi:hypothetical protein
MDDGVAEETYCRSRFATAHYLLNKDTGETLDINCKSWRCPIHAAQWAAKWFAVLSVQISRSPVDRLLCLTTAPPAASPAQLCRARQLFFRSLRRLDAGCEYFATLEFTSASRLPHMHILLYSDYFAQAMISDAWRSATEQAGMSPAHIVYIERPRSQDDSARYAIKHNIYTDHAKEQEIPDNWHGRKIGYSRHFFAKPVAEIWRDIITERHGPLPEEQLWELKSYPTRKFLSLKKGDLEDAGAERIPYYDY